MVLKLLLKRLFKSNLSLNDLQEVKKKAELVEITYPGNEIWSNVNSRLEEIIKIIKSDKKLYQW